MTELQEITENFFSNPRLRIMMRHETIRKSCITEFINKLENSQVTHQEKIQRIIEDALFFYREKQINTDDSDFDKQFDFLFFPPQPDDSMICSDANITLLYELMWQKHNNYAPLIANYFWDTFFQNISLPHKKELIFYFFPYLSDDYKEKYYQMIKSLMLTFKDDFPNDLTNILEMKNQEGISYLSFHYLKIY